MVNLCCQPQFIQNLKGQMLGSSGVRSSNYQDFVLVLLPPTGENFKIFHKVSVSIFQNSR